MTSSAPPGGGDARDAAPITPMLTFILALACGVVVANIYYIQPLVGLISRDFAMPVALAGLLVTVTQLGYAAGLILIVPLGDIVENRRLILSLLSLLILALLGAAFAANGAIFLVLSLLIGIAASTVQIIVPFAGHLAPDATRGRVVGNVVSGLFFGIMLSRPVASFAAHLLGHRSIFAVSAAVTAALVLLLARTLPERRARGIPYLQALRSLGPILLKTKVLHRRGGYQVALFGAFSVFWTAVPLLLESPRFGFNQVGIGLFALVGAAGAIVSPYAGRAADRGLGYIVTGVSLVAAIAALIVGLIGGIVQSWMLLVVTALLLDMAVAANLVIGQRAIFALGAEMRGRLNGLFLGLFFIGGAFGSLVAGYAYAVGGWTACMLVGLIFPFLALAYFSTERRRG